MVRVWKYGDHVNTDLMISGRYLDDYDISSLAKHAMEDIDAEFVDRVEAGDIIVAGRNFGCGSSREQAPAVLKEKGVGAVFARSTARIFHRNAINIGLPVLISQDACQLLESGDEVELDISSGTLIRSRDNLRMEFEPLPEYLMKILDKGGLIPYTREMLSE